MSISLKSVSKAMSFSFKVKREIAKISNSDNHDSNCDKRAFLRQAYLGGGTMIHPKKAYHMEFAAQTSAQKQQLLEAFAFFGLTPKEYSRQSGDILYFKEAEQISTVLNIIGAHVALMEFENCRVDKDVNNAINRVANATAANEDKVIAAAARHVKDIMDIQRLAGLSILESSLAQVAQIRLDDPLASLEDIGKRLTPPISKSGVNHRLKRIGKIAEKYRISEENRGKNHV